MRFVENEIYHIYNRGNNHQTIFFSEENYLNFLSRVKFDWVPVCDILTWCLMPNHFHFIIHATGSSIFEIPSYGGKPMQILARKIGLTLSSYSQYINRQNKTSGSLFQQKTKAKCISAPDKFEELAKGSLVSRSSYIINCMHYIHQNPWKAGLVNKIEDWPYSSFNDYTGHRKGTLCKKDLLFQLTGYDEKKIYQDSYKVIDDFFT